MDHKILGESKLFEKIQIDWFSEKELKTRRNEFREFYREIVDIFIDKIENIRSFIHKRGSRKTRKNRDV